MSHYAGARNRLAKREAAFLVYAGPSQLRKAPSENALQKHLVGGLTAGGVKGGCPMSSRRLRTLLLVLPLLALACGDDAGEGGTPDSTPPTVRQIQPTGGPIAGNTLINVYGSGFQNGATVFLGDLELQRTVVVNSFRIYGYSPTATSAQVDVRVVNPDGAYGVLVKGFTYEGPPAPNISQAEVLNGNTDAVSGGQPVGVTVRGAIIVAGLTRGVGQGGGVQAQVGFAPGNAELLNAASYTWETATYEMDSDSGEADIYKGNVLLQPPIGGENREWVITLRFSIDGGKTWVMADGDGIANGVTAQMLRRVFIARPRVDYCKLGPDGSSANPELFYRSADTTLLKVAGQVYAAGITQGAGAGSGLVAQLGIGPENSDPRNSAAWTWTRATYKTEHGNNDEWEAELPNPGTAGRYLIAFRFSISENAWRVCDADGVNDSTSGPLTFSVARLGVLTVGNEAPKPKVGWCKIGEDQKAPEAINYLTTQSGDLKTVFAQVHMAGVTDKVGAGPGLVGQLGWGPAGEDPRTSLLWNWSTPLAWNKDNFNVNDEWKGTLPNPGTAGEYRYAVRFAANGGPVRVCDGNGVDDGGQDFELGQLGTLTVQPPAPVVGVCRLQSVSGMTVGSGDAVTAVGRVRIPGVTNGDGAGANLQVQVGVGPASVDASTSAGAFTWAPATYSREAEGEENTDEFTVRVHPAYTGNRSVSMRYSTNGTTWSYCDLDGSDVGGYTQGQQHALTVGAPSGGSILDYCKLQWPFKTSANGGNRDAYAYIYEAGVTTAPEANPNIVAELGYGPKEQDPGVGTGWTWVTGSFKGNQGDDDEYTANLPQSAPTGSGYLWRIRMGSGPYCYGDWQPAGDVPGGSANGANPEWLGTVDT